MQQKGSKSEYKEALTQNNDPTVENISLKPIQRSKNHLNPAQNYWNFQRIIQRLKRALEKPTVLVDPL